MSSETKASHRFALLRVGSALVELPCFFASISSVKSNFQPIDSARLLAAVEFPQILVSAYDIAQNTGRTKEAFHRVLATARDAGMRVLIDSGNYEGYWLRDASWTRERYHKILLECPCDLAFSFDKPRANGGHRDPRQVAIGTRLDQRNTEAPVCPILHTKSPDEKFTRAVVALAQEVNPPMVAIAERELGEGVLARARTIASLRGALDNAGLNTPIHVLGTGNPLSLLLFSAAGASSFDGLEWCQTVVDHDTGLLHHFQHFDLFREQTRIGREPAIDFPAAALLHNLFFYRNWMTTVRELVSRVAAGYSEGKRIPIYSLPAQIGLVLAEQMPEWFEE